MAPSAGRDISHNFRDLTVLTAPSATLLFLARVLGLFLLAGGILRIVSIFSNSSSWGWKLAGGIIGVFAGILVLEHPLFSVVLAPVVVFVVGILAVIQGGSGLSLGLRGGGWGVAY